MKLHTCLLSAGCLLALTLPTAAQESRGSRPVDGVSFQRVLEMFDTNKDGVLDEREKAAGRLALRGRGAGRHKQDGQRDAQRSAKKDGAQRSTPERNPVERMRERRRQFFNKESAEGRRRPGGADAQGTDRKRPAQKDVRKERGRRQKPTKGRMRSDSRRSQPARRSAGRRSAGHHGRESAHRGGR